MFHEVCHKSTHWRCFPQHPGDLTDVMTPWKRSGSYFSYRFGKFVTDRLLSHSRTHSGEKLKMQSKQTDKLAIFLTFINKSVGAITVIYTVSIQIQLPSLMAHNRDACIAVITTITMIIIIIIIIIITIITKIKCCLPWCVWFTPRPILVARPVCLFGARVVNWKHACQSFHCPGQGARPCVAALVVVGHRRRAVHGRFG